MAFLGAPPLSGHVLGLWPDYCRGINVLLAGHPDYHVCKGQKQYTGTWRCTHSCTILIQKHYFKIAIARRTHLFSRHAFHGHAQHWVISHKLHLFAVPSIPECHFGCHFGNGLHSHYFRMMDERTKPAKRMKRVHKWYISTFLIPLSPAP